MVIDVHCHFWDPSLLQGGMRSLMESVERELGVRDPEMVRDGSVDRLLREMDEAGIEKSVLLPLDFEFVADGGDLTFRDFNDLAGKAALEHPDRLVAFAGVDPRRGAAAVAELRRCVERWGARGLKLWTVTGFSPSDERFYPLYEEAARLGVHVLVHTGLGPGETYMETCQPVLVDRIAVDFRSIRFILAHVGSPWVDEALAVAAKNPNVYVDISAWQQMALGFPLGMAQMLCQAKLMHGGLHKVLFGSDWPLFTEACSQKDWVERVRGLEPPAPLQMMGLPELSDEDRAGILGGNARAALDL